MSGKSTNRESAKNSSVALPVFFGRWLSFYRWLPAVAAAILWITLVYGLPLQSLRAARQLAREELTHLLQNNRPDTAAILNAFDQATERIIFSAVGPYFILTAATVFLIAHLMTVKRRLDTAERDIRVLRDVMLGVDGIRLK